jgi:hypothetical protein
MLASSTSRTVHRSGAVATVPAPTSRAADSQGAHCDCDAHRAIISRRAARPGRPSMLIALLPLLACAFCPACLTLWAPLLASLGLGFALPEAVHPAGIAIAVLVALAPAALRARRAKVWRPLLLVAAGAAVLVATHTLGGGRFVELLGALSFVFGSFLERRASSVTLLLKGDRRDTRMCVERRGRGGGALRAS